MVERGEYLRLALETLYELGIAGEVLAQQLYRNIPIKFGVVRMVNNTHAAFPDLPEDAVTTHLLVDHAQTFAGWPR
jgi:hypothetical protein